VVGPLKKRSHKKHFKIMKRLVECTCVDVLLQMSTIIYIYGTDYTLLQNYLPYSLSLESVQLMFLKRKEKNHCNSSQIF
jgi:hypothetical protein